jgi:hypothetical protein
MAPSALLMRLSPPPFFSSSWRDSESLSPSMTMTGTFSLRAWKISNRPSGQESGGGQTRC